MPDRAAFCGPSNFLDLSIYLTPLEKLRLDNRIFRLGDDMLVRLPSAEAYAAQFEKEQRWLPILAPHLPLPIPVPLEVGRATDSFQWNWSVYRWIEGESATVERVDDPVRFANDLAGFLCALQKIPATGGPAPGRHNFFRGGPLAIYDGETRDAISNLNDEVDATTVTEVWETALDAAWDGSPVWLHGDLSPANLLIRRGRLNAVIDFGCLAVGDPACDLTIAWTMFSGESRETFRDALRFDHATWARGRGWAIWKGLITLVGHAESSEGQKARLAIEEVIRDHRNAG